jgi:hypothetical protein
MPYSPLSSPTRDSIAPCQPLEPFESALASYVFYVFLAKRSDQPNSKGHDDCIISLRAHRDARMQRRHQELVERPATPFPSDQELLAACVKAPSRAVRTRRDNWHDGRA